MAQFVFLDARTKKKREISQAAMDLIKSLCKRSPTSRLGQGSTADFIQRSDPNSNGWIHNGCPWIPAKGYQKGGVQDIRNHKWFTGFDWDGLQCGQVQGPLYRSTIHDEQLRADINSKRVMDLGAALPREVSGWDESFWRNKIWKKLNKNFIFSATPIIIDQITLQYTIQFCSVHIILLKCWISTVFWILGLFWIGILAEFWLNFELMLHKPGKSNQLESLTVLKNILTVLVLVTGVSHICV